MSLNPLSTVPSNGSLISRLPDSAVKRSARRSLSAKERPTPDDQNLNHARRRFQQSVCHPALFSIRRRTLSSHQRLLVLTAANLAILGTQEPDNYNAISGEEKITAESLITGWMLRDVLAGVAVLQSKIQDRPAASSCSYRTVLIPQFLHPGLSALHPHPTWR